MQKIIISCQFTLANHNIVSFQKIEIETKQLIEIILSLIELRMFEIDISWNVLTENYHNF